MDKNNVLTLYKSLIRPHLDYGNSILPSHQEEQAHLRKCSEKKYKTSARIKGFAI